MTNLNNVVVNALDELKAINISNLDVVDITSITNNMIIATGTSSTHVKAIADNVIDKIKQANISIFGIEGEDYKEWILIDLGDTVVHVMQSSAREYYQLEKLWTVIPDSNEIVAHA